MKYIYKTKGTCSKQIEIEIDDNTNTIINVHFIGGCPGNTFGVSTLVKGQNVDAIIKSLEGIPCGNKGTSCPDQLAKALKQIQSNE